MKSYQDNIDLSSEQKVQRGRRKSVARTVTQGLAVMVVALISLSVLALLGFLSFSNTLSYLTENAVPRIVQSSQVASLGHQLLYETERLSSAKSDPQRRIAHKSTVERFEQIDAMIMRGEGSDSNKLRRDLKVLESTLNELNQLVKDRISVEKKAREALRDLYLFKQEMVAFDNEVRSLNETRIGLFRFSSWLSKAIEITSIAGNVEGLGILYKVKRAEKQLRDEFAELENISEMLPDSMREKAGLLEAKLGQILIGNDGLMFLHGEKIKISRKSAGRSNFTQSLVMEFEIANASLFDEVIQTMSQNTKVLSERVQRVAFLFTIFSITAMLAAVGVVYLFRRRLIQRLIALNNAIIDKMSGKDVTIEDDGNDEISDMARSFKFYAKEVVSRENKLIELATKDVLTGVNNRRRFMDKGSKELIRGRRYGYSLVFLMMDIDHFKTINDSLGHHSGDEVLKKVSNLCMEILREVDLFGRIGGEEFGALLPEADLIQGMMIAERVRQKVEESVWSIDGEIVTCTLSIGVAQSGVEDISLGDLMKKADAALYIAKNRGRNQCYGHDKDKMK